MRTRFDRCLVKSHNLHCCDHFGAQGIWATAMNPCVAELATGFFGSGNKRELFFKYRRSSYQIRSCGVLASEFRVQNGSSVSSFLKNSNLGRW